MTHLRASSVSSRFISFLSFLFLSVLSTAVYSEPCQKVTRSLPGISLKIYEGLDKVQLHVNPNQEQLEGGHVVDIAKGQLELEKLEKRCQKSGCNGLEYSQIYAMEAYIAFQKEDTLGAVESYKKVLAQSPQIPIGTEILNRWYVAQLEYTLENYDAAIENLVALVSVSKLSCSEVGAEVPHLHAMACYNKGDNSCALEKVDAAISLVESKNNGAKIAEESWYNLKRQLHVDREDFVAATQVLEKMLVHYPKKQYYAALPQLYGITERELEQTLALDAAYTAGALSRESELLNLAKIYLMEDVPYSAAKLLSESMNKSEIESNEANLSLLAIAWRSAKEFEKSANTLEQFAAESDHGGHYADLVSVYLDLDRPEAAIAAGKKALKKGNFKGQLAGELHINMGAAYIDLRDYEQAVASFEKASEYEKYHSFVQGWLSYAKNENLRHQRLKASLADVGVDIDQLLKN